MQTGKKINGIELKTWEKTTHVYSQLIFDKGAKKIQWKKTAFLTNGAGSNRSILISLYKAQVEVDQRFTHKIRHSDFIEEKVGTNLEHMGTGENFLNRTPMAYALRTRIDRWDLIKLQSFCKANDAVNRTKMAANC